jgi:hypothetical protein
VAPAAARSSSPSLGGAKSKTSAGLKNQLEGSGPAGASTNVVIKDTWMIFARDGAGGRSTCLQLPVANLRQVLQVLDNVPVVLR